MLFGLSGSDPRATSNPSGKPSPSVSGFRGSVPRAISSALVRPSVSGSALGSGPGMLMVLNTGVPGKKPTIGVGSEDPAEFTPTKVNFPNALPAIATLRVAEFPAGAMEALVTVTLD